MTCQVVLYNKLGIALASDSAVTSSRGKVMMGSEKIFELNPPHKLATLTSGNAAFMGYPWEIVFSAWSETLQSPLNGIEEYYEALAKYLKTLVPRSTQNDYISNFASDIASDFREVFDQVLTPFYKSLLNEDLLKIFLESGWDDEFRSEMTQYLSEEVIQTLHARLENLMSVHKENFERAEEVSDSQSYAWVEDFMNSVDISFEDYFLSDWPRVPLMFDFAKRAIATKIIYPDFSNSSTICMAGYGSRDVFPSLFYFSIHGCLGGTLITSWRKHWEPAPYAQRLFLGQNDAISSLFIGDDQLLTQTAIKSQDKALMELSEKLATVNDESAKMVNDFAQEQREYLGQEIRKVGRERRSEPFYRAIGLAPILDLAEFASQLVGIQSAYSAMNHDNPTVGGTIDVAVITHRDGFQWIRQKGQ